MDANPHKEIYDDVTIKPRVKDPTIYTTENYFNLGNPIDGKFKGDSVDLYSCVDNVANRSQFHSRPQNLSPTHLDKTVKACDLSGDRGGYCEDFEGQVTLLLPK